MIVQAFDRIETALKERANAPQGLTPNRPISIGGLAVNATRTCSVPECERPHAARGLCKMHWQRMSRYGSVDVPTRPPVPLEDRFWRKVAKGEGCWEWQAARDSNGYGVFNKGEGRGLDRAHRVAYELLVGAIPPGLVLDHLCRNKSCCNPGHLEPVTIGENIRRGYPRNWPDEGMLR